MSTVSTEVTQLFADYLTDEKDDGTYTLALNEEDTRKLTEAVAEWMTLERLAKENKERELAEAKADNDSLRTLWTEIRTVLIQSRAANCVCAYGKIQADAVEAANAVLNRMPPDVATERDQLRAEVERLKRGLIVVRDSCENCTNGDDLRTLAAQVIGKNEDKSPMVFHSEYYNCERFSRLEKEATQLRARVTELEQDKVRLDWLDEPPSVEETSARLSVVHNRLVIEARSIRATIDAAMKGTP